MKRETGESGKRLCCEQMKRLGLAWSTKKLAAKSGAAPKVVVGLTVGFVSIWFFDMWSSCGDWVRTSQYRVPPDNADLQTFGSRDLAGAPNLTQQLDGMPPAWPTQAAGGVTLCMLMPIALLGWLPE